MELKITNTKLVDAKPARYTYRTKIFIWPEGETLLDNLENRRNRPLKAFRRVAMEVLDNMGVDKSRLEIKWSQRAGCACGCSPGFIVDGWIEKLHRKDLHVTVEE